jgi:hypothetical protein
MKSLLLLLTLSLALAPAVGLAQSKQRVFDFDGPVYADKKGNVIIPPEKGTRPESTPTVITNWSVPGAKLVRYDGLDLKIVSGTATRRIATINNQSFLTGETLRVTLKNTNVQISCLEIRERSVLVKVQGEQTPRELKLQAWQ